MTRVLQVIKGLARGGAEQLLVSGARHFNQSRFSYQVAYLLPTHHELAEDLHQLGVRTTCLDGASGLGWISRLRRLIVESKIALVHFHSPYAAIGARFAVGNIPIVYTEHNLWNSYHPLTRWGNALTYARNSHVFTVSEQVAASIQYPQALRFLKMPPVEVLYQGIDPELVNKIPAGARSVRDELAIPAAARLIGCVGSLKAQKGHTYLLEAVSELRRRLPDIRLVLVGSGVAERDIRSAIKRLQLEEAVVLAGHRADASRILAEVDVFVLASTHEGLPIALLEAMAMGKAVVTTTAGGIPEVVTNGLDGLLVNPRDPAGLAGALEKVLEQPDLRRTLGRAAKTRAAFFDIRKTVGRTEGLYASLIG